MLLLRALVLLVGCTNNPIEDCPTTAHDCCDDDAQCADYYGAAFPICHSGGRGAGKGICAECRRADDCWHGETCVLDDEIGGWCLAL